MVPVTGEGDADAGVATVGAAFPADETMRIVLADEISPDSCRLWDVKTNDKMDKDRFRKDLGGMIEAYTEVARRLGVVQENEYARADGPRLVK